jgi:GTPase SAR1 family protein
MQGIFFGLPRSGKTSTKKRLTGQKPALEQPSTGVAEEVTRVEIESQQPILEQTSTGVAEEVTRVEMEDIEKTTVQILTPSIWNEVTDLSEEAAIVVEDVTTHFTQDRESSVASRKLVQQIMKSQATAPIPNVIKRIIRKAKKKFIQKSNAVVIVPPSADMEQALQEESICASSDPMEILGFALQKSAVIKHQGRILQFTLYISDAGGQPEFQESLPALVSGPSVYFLTFPLHKGLNEKIPVEYQHPSGRSIIPFEASCTTKEILLSSLASIASTRSYIKLEDEKPVTPKVLFIATHKDKLGSEQDLQKIDQELQEVIRSTIAYKEEMIVFCSEKQMVFALDNTSDDDKDIQQVRDAVERLGLQSDDYKIRTPHTWMLFAVTLRHLPGRVLSIEDCMQVANECGITDRSELDDALWFLHHNVGIVRHFQEVPELRDVVIKEPQYIFDKVTELIIQTFTFDKIGPMKCEEFMKLGLFTSDVFSKYLTSDSDTLTGDKLAIALKHLNVIAPIEENGIVVKYFAPVALSHAELPPPDSQSEEIIPSIRMVFGSGFCPKGMFGALLVNLLKQQKISQHDCKLKEDRIYRDQICLSIGPYDSFQFSLSPTYIKIALSTTIDCNRKIPLGQVCCDVRREIESSIRSVTETLHYTQRASHSLAFACPEPPPHDQSHSATINFSPKGEPCTMTCQLTRKLYPDLPDGHMTWFDEVGHYCIKRIEVFM